MQNKGVYEYKKMALEQKRERETYSKGSLIFLFITPTDKLFNFRKPTHRCHVKRFVPNM